MTEELLTVQEVSKRLKVNPQTVRNWITRKELIETRVGERRVRVAESELARFLKLQVQTSQAAVARPQARIRRRATVHDVDAVSEIIDLMLSTASTLPVGSLLARELAESAGRLQLTLRVPGGSDSGRLRGSDGSPSTASGQINSDSPD